MHLPVADQNSSPGQERANFLRHAFNGHHPVMQKEDLAAAIELALDGVPNHPFVVLRDDGFDRQTIVWRGLNGTHVPRAG